MAAEDHFNAEDRRRIRASIAEAEKNTSGEIRIFIEDQCGENVLDAAAFIFHKLGMEKTRLRNGVLFYLAVSSRQFAIIGDSGIHEKVKDDFWYEIKRTMQNFFVEGRYVDGLSTGIRMAGEALKKHFPHQTGDKNELGDDIVFGKKPKKN
ncbi:MAG: TPM domain-containing protein [Bacteroidia bacterium]|nr:TPM domain-containing protein [Bacteroidia bacterium]